jgi:hypothetical protein
VKISILGYIPVPGKKPKIIRKKETKTLAYNSIN